jgi:transmembrane sensor
VSLSGRYIQKGNQVDISKKQELFQKYVAGKASDEEVDLLMLLINEGGTDDLGPQADELWQENRLFPPMEEAGARMKAQVMEVLQHDDGGNTWEMPYWMRVAAVLLPVVMISVALYWISSDRYVEEITATAELSPVVEKANPRGQKSTLILPDGSVVTLNASSKLSYRENFEQSERRVVLEGEAFFDVTRDENRPFIIETDQITTKVLGTSFIVRAYPGAGEVKVAVASGKVSVQKSSAGTSPQAGEALLLLPGEMGVYAMADQTLNKTPFDERDLFGWKDGLIYFNNASFNEVKDRLEQWYGVDIRVDKAIVLEKDFSGSYKNKPLDLVLHGLAFVYDFDYEIRDKSVRIY